MCACCWLSFVAVELLGIDPGYCAHLQVFEGAFGQWYTVLWLRTHTIRAWRLKERIRDSSSLEASEFFYNHQLFPGMIHHMFAVIICSFVEKLHNVRNISIYT